jgi:glycerol-3-phosphate dehydrogenase
MYDVAIIGAGIIGTSIAREIAGYNLKAILIEKESDVANGTTKANSAIIHAGYDPEPGTLKAMLNVRGNRMFEGLCAQLGVPYQKIGSLVVALSEEELQTLKKLYERGLKNGVCGLEIICKEQLKEMEPVLSDTAVGALYAPTTGIVDPYLLAIALAEHAVENGVEVRMNSPVTSIKKAGGCFLVNCPGGTLLAKYVINAAGLYADSIHEMVSPSTFKILPNRGQYYLLDKSAGRFVKHVIFPCPTALGKGVLISPTVHGNLLVGPNHEEVEGKIFTQTTAEGLESVKFQAGKIAKGLPFHEVITSFSGLRASSASGDFIIGEAEEAKGFINVAAIDSPGLAASPAVALYVLELLQEIGGPCGKKTGYNPVRKNYTPFMELPDEEKARLIKADPRYGRIICRCENITEGEIVRAIQGPVGARTVDGVKKRARTGCGRCQGGFCTPKVMNIIAGELGIDLNEVTKDGPGSYILTGPTKGRRVDCNTAGSANIIDGAENRISENNSHYDLVVIGGGPAGMAAASAARDCGVKDILIIERDGELGGILQQCIHNGFGLHIFKEELTGPEYAEMFINEIKGEGITCKLDTTVLHVSRAKVITYLNSRDGLATINAGAVVLAMGCRERPRGAVNIPGTRPSGIFSAGTAQRFVNMEGYMVGKKVVVFGSGDIGLIMARRMTLEGAEIVAVVERKPYSEGLTRNLVQCVEDFNIPLLLSHTIVDIKGENRVRGITVARVDHNKKPVEGTNRDLACDTVFFSRGLIPENELSINAGIALSSATNGPVVNESMETSVEGIFACGNVVHVHDLVDWVTEESKKAGRGAAGYILRQRKEPGFTFYTKPGEGIGYIVPHVVRTAHIRDILELYMRVRGHHENAVLLIKANGSVISKVKKKVLTPGEMVVVKLKKTDWPPFCFEELTIELEKEHGQ